MAWRAILVGSSKRSRRARLRLSLVLIALFFIIDIFRVMSFRPDIKQIGPKSDGAHPHRIFIASIHWNNGDILRSHWNAALLEVVRYFGAENVYVAILESGSWDNSKDVLRHLDADLAKLGVEKTVELEDKTHIDEIAQVPSSNQEGWIWTSRERLELRRIPYLSRLRNRVMQKLNELAERDKPRHFDKVLWLNDVIFTTEDVLNLLHTNDGQYAAACSLDFSRPPSYYDTFALRDDQGNKPIMSSWPYFRSYSSRHALRANSPVPVRSCWNGMVMFDAKPFYSSPPLAFRGVQDSLAKHHLEGSECCLIHADNPLSAEKGVWLNPIVRVGYNADAYEAVRFKGTHWPTNTEKFRGTWRNRWLRLTSWPQQALEDAVVSWRLRSWRSGNSSGPEGRKAVEPGSHCLINEMQVLADNGWAHV